MAVAAYRGYNAPFTGGLQHLLSHQANERLIKNDILQLLLTAPGERVMMPDFGTVIRKLPFEQADERLMSEVQQSVRQAMDRYEKRVNVNDVVVELNQDEQSMIIKVFCTLKDEVQKKILVEAKISL
ncbi:MAG: GPW/gp25 family protein [Candidatus Nanopelagicaceae bacterium]|nr:GPW/gp25 family protein [Candidatus Nanopelagicaceae bacterium]